MQHHNAFAPLLSYAGLLITAPKNPYAYPLLFYHAFLNPSNPFSYRSFFGIDDYIVREFILLCSAVTQQLPIERLTPLLLALSHRTDITSDLLAVVYIDLLKRIGISPPHLPIVFFPLLFFGNQQTWQQVCELANDWEPLVRAQFSALHQEYANLVIDASLTYLRTSENFVWNAVASIEALCSVRPELIEHNLYLLSPLVSLLPKPNDAKHALPKTISKLIHIALAARNKITPKRNIRHQRQIAQDLIDALPRPWQITLLLEFWTEDQPMASSNDTFAAIQANIGIPRQLPIATSLATILRQPQDAAAIERWIQFASPAKVCRLCQHCFPNVNHSAEAQQVAEALSPWIAQRMLTDYKFSETLAPHVPHLAAYREPIAQLNQTLAQTQAHIQVRLSVSLKDISPRAFTESLTLAALLWEQALNQNIGTHYAMKNIQQYVACASEM